MHMEGDGDELEDPGCLPRLLENVQSVHVVSSYFTHVLTRHGMYSRAAFISLSASNCVYSRAASIRGNTVGT